ncbi:hypothetical protein Anas_05877 [Armadillidium nasatum]|uniref:Uncharacterized protein n=1 Tax=Armadillidium nasatum TaxID=96803 RepID=A0A5N5TB11_9CRUS|nr:hypothetical protein Anas_05877 [Armadillidium nasatum]
MCICLCVYFILWGNYCNYSKIFLLYSRQIQKDKSESKGLMERLGIRIRKNENLESKEIKDAEESLKTMIEYLFPTSNRAIPTTNYSQKESYQFYQECGAARFWVEPEQEPKFHWESYSEPESYFSYVEKWVESYLFRNSKLFETQQELDSEIRKCLNLNHKDWKRNRTLEVRIMRYKFRYQNILPKLVQDFYVTIKAEMSHDWSE